MLEIIITVTPKRRTASSGEKPIFVLWEDIDDAVDESLYDEDGDKGALRILERTYPGISKCFSKMGRNKNTFLGPNESDNLEAQMVAGEDKGWLCYPDGSLRGAYDNGKRANKTVLLPSGKVVVNKTASKVKEVKESARASKKRIQGEIDELHKQISAISKKIDALSDKLFAKHPGKWKSVDDVVTPTIRKYEDQADALWEKMGTLRSRLPKKPAKRYKLEYNPMPSHY